MTNIKLFQTEVEDRILVQEREYPIEASDEALSVGKKATVSVEHTEKIENLTAEVKNLKVLIESYKGYVWPTTFRSLGELNL